MTRLRTGVRSIRASEALMVAGAVACLAIALVRLVVGGSEVVAVHASEWQSASASREETPYADAVLTRLTDSPRFRTWWGSDRRVPFREGGDFFGVMAKSSSSRSLGNVIGVVAERRGPNDPVIDLLILPKDRVALYGDGVGAVFTRADGVKFRTQWARPSRDIRRFSSVETTESDYAPELMATEVARIESQTELVEVARDVFFAQPDPSYSGTWILYARQRESREYLVIPIELSPTGGDL